MICSDAKQIVGCGKQREATAPIQSLVKPQPWLLSLRWKTCLRQNCSQGSCACSEGPALGQNTLMMNRKLVEGMEWNCVGLFNTEEGASNSPQTSAKRTSTWCNTQDPQLIMNHREGLKSRRIIISSKFK